MASAWLERRATAGGKARYLVKYQLGGRRTPKHYAGSFKTKAEATLRRQWISGELAALRVPDLTLLSEPVSAPTFAQAAKRWQVSRVDVADNTTIQHRTAIGRALPTLGARPINEITAQDVADLVATLHTKKKKRETIRKTVTAIAMTLDHARISPNPARDKLTVKLPREEAEEPNPPDAAQLIAIYRLLPSNHRLPFLFLDWSGARVAAINKTLVGDYDETRRRVRLRKATTKKGQGVWIDLHPDLADAIEATLPPREDRDLDARLFPESSDTTLRTAMAKASRAVGVPVISPHDLRHRRISLLHLRGVPWARIGEMVGQKDLAVTANTYTHVIVDTTELHYEALLAGRA